MMSADEQAAYDAWLKAKVAASLADERPTTPHGEVMKQMRALIERHRQAQQR